MPLAFNIEKNVKGHMNDLAEHATMQIANPAHDVEGGWSPSEVGAVCRKHVADSLAACKGGSNTSVLLKEEAFQIPQIICVLLSSIYVFAHNVNIETSIPVSHDSNETVIEIRPLMLQAHLLFIFIRTWYDSGGHGSLRTCNQSIYTIF